MRTIACIIALSACALLVNRDGQAQVISEPLGSPVDLTSEAGPLRDVQVIAVPTTSAPLIRQSGPTDRVIVRGLGSPADRAAAVDPGIVIKPDPTIDAMIIKIRPTVDVDPKMIIPQPPPSIEFLGREPGG